ncbi:unnamed protein product, partial [Iphiclides podalirius]
MDAGGSGSYFVAPAQHHLEEEAGVAEDCVYVFPCPRHTLVHFYCVMNERSALGVVGGGRPRTGALQCTPRALFRVIEPAPAPASGANAVLQNEHFI